MKFFTFFSCSTIPRVIKNPPIQKKVSTAKYAAGRIVVRPGVVKISKLSVQFLIFINLNQEPWPKTIQNIDKTLVPFKKSKF